ncbi:MAG: branched-chain amino acid ABC transporter permease [Micavibrio sp.]|jgi:branched-chain amino acid transport system permease protein|nr:branched-chain amino acid ABC transporter permease [Micavibrio sp.]|tara:strand:+ start:120 stop:1202 length:1083 start_codon:yes stop_codon:yes gene_type:complete
MTKLTELNNGKGFIYLCSLLICLLLLVTPFVFPGVKFMEVGARICIFIVLVASYDLLIGYTGIVSFGHTMFFGLGAYGTAIALKQFGPDWSSVLLGGGSGILIAIIIALVIGSLSLRIKTIFFAMITLAVASMVMVLASQLSGLTGGEDGITYRIPELFNTSTKLLTDADNKVVELWGVRLNGKLAAYYFVWFTSLLIFLVLLRVTASPLGRVLLAIRENEQRAEAIGYQAVFYRTFIFAFSAAIAALVGSVYAIWLKYTGPDTAFSFNIMIDLLLMVVIGGMGTMWGSVLGASLLVLAHYFLRDLMEIAVTYGADLPLIPLLLNPDRWLLWLGVAFIILVYSFPAGIAGSLIRQQQDEK